MFQRELLTVGALAAAIFLAVAGAGWFTVRELHEYSSKLVEDTLPGLVDSGLAGERMHDNRHTMREMLFPHTASELDQLIGVLGTSRTEALWQDYATTIYEPEDQQNFQNMMQARSNYLAGEPRLFALVKAGRIPEATAHFHGGSWDAFARYETGVRTLFEYNVQQGRHRAKFLLEINRYVQGVIAIFGLVLFLLGLAAGFRLALGSTRWVRAAISNRET